MHDACEKDAWRYNAGVLDDPSLPEVGSGGRVRLKEALLERHTDTNKLTGHTASWAGRAHRSRQASHTACTP